MTDLRIKPRGRSVVTYETTSIEIFMDPVENAGRLSSLFSVTRNQGYATALMNMMCDWADENGVYLWLVAKPYGTPHGTLNPAQLINFYERFGFTPKPAATRNTLHRKPQKRR
jgi:GNAT superfamily N-acetyltransferase